MLCNCRASETTKDDQLCARIQIEFDTFVLRSSNYVYLSRFLGAWQYLATLPFSEVHISTAWKLYYMLTSGFTQDLIENVKDGMSAAFAKWFIFTYCAYIVCLNILDFQVVISQSAFLEQFNFIVIDVPAEDMYYLLQTFGSMALARDITDIDFIRCITTDLFKASVTLQNDRNESQFQC